MVKTLEVKGITTKGKGIIHFQSAGFVIEAISDKDDDVFVSYEDLIKNFDNKAITFNFSTKIEDEVTEQ